MLNRKLFPGKDPVIGDCQQSGDEGMELVKSGDIWVIPEIKAERDRAKVKPTNDKKHQDWKEDFDRWNG